MAFGVTPINIKERRAIIVNIPTIVSSSLEGAVNTEKLLKFYERIFAYHYLKDIVMLTNSRETNILSMLSKLNNIIMPLSFLVGTGILLYVALGKKDSAAGEIGNILTGRKLNEGKIKTFAEAVYLLENAKDKVDITKIEIGENIVATFIAHVSNRENISPRELLISSLRHNNVPVFEKDFTYHQGSETKIIQLAFSRPSYITTVVEYDELKQKHGVIKANFVLLDFSTDEVIVLLLDKQEKHVKYVTTVRDVLEKPSSPELDVNQLLNILRGVRKD